MIKNFFSPSSLKKATFLISFTTVLSYILGLLRDRIIANEFGTTALTDAYNTAFIIPDFLFNLFIAGALSAAFLPVFSEYLIKDKKQAFSIANTLLTGASMLIGILSIITFFSLNFIVPILFKDAPIEMHQTIINLTKILLLGTIIFAISNSLGNILMSYKHFFAYSFSVVFYNLGIILGIIFLNEKYGIYSAAIGTIIGGILQCSFRMIDIYFTDYKYKPELNIKHPGFKKIIKLMIPKSISLIAWPINQKLFANVGAILATGGYAAFNYARNIQSFAVATFGISFATAVYPSLAKSISENKNEEFSDQIRKSVQQILFFTVPSMIGLLVLNKEIVTLLLKNGIFDENSVKLTSSILFFFAISIPFESLVHILARGYYAFQNTTTPMIFSLIGMSIIAFSTIYLAPKYGITWFSIGFSIGYATQVILLTIFLSKKIQNLNIKKLIISTLKTSIASLIMGGIIYFSKPYIHSIIKIENLYNVALIIIGGFTYFLAAFIIKSEELSSIKFLYKKLKWKI